MGLIIFPLVELLTAEQARVYAATSNVWSAPILLEFAAALFKGDVYEMPCVILYVHPVMLYTNPSTRAASPIVSAVRVGVIYNWPLRT